MADVLHHGRETANSTKGTPTMSRKNLILGLILGAMSLFMYVAIFIRLG